MKCFIRNCVNSDKINKISDGRATTPHRITFHTFPKDPKQRAAWLESLCIPSFTVTPKHVICSEHFKEDDFYQTKLGTRRVKYGVVPVINYDQQQPASRVCKLCLKIDAKMYDLKEDSLNKMYQYVVGIEPRTDPKDRFPMNVCWECKSRLQSAAAFKSKALTSDQLLQEHLNYNEELNITEISKLYREHNLKSTLIIKELYNHDYEAINSTESDTFVKTERTGYAIEEVIDESSQIDEIVIKNENNVTEDDRKAEIETAPSNSEDKFENEAPKVNWDNIILVKTPTITDYQFNISVFENNIKMAEDDQAIDDSFDMNIDDGNDVEEKVVVENTIRRGRRKKEEATKNRWIVSQKKPYVKPTIPIDETVFTVKALSQERLIEEVMARKNSARYLRARFKCTVCYKGFPNKDKLDRHSLKHSEKAGPLKCVICMVRMKLSRQMRAHMKKQHTSEFICKLCPLVTRNRHVALGHMKFHAGSKYMCPQCSVQFEKQTTLLNHLRLKHVSDCVCELCGYTFVGANGVRAHKRMRHRFDEQSEQLKGPYCEVCDIKFLNNKAYRKHLRLSSKHLKSEDDPNRLSNDPSIKTRRLDRYTAPVRRITIHRREDIDIPNGTVTCEQCGVESGGVRAYSRHFRRAHPGLLPTQCGTAVNPYMCEHCGKMFLNTTTLEGHMWVHTGQKRFQCDHCHKTFSMKSNLAGHMKQHEAVRQSYACQLCGKQFAFNHNLTRHLRVHTGERPFKCGACEKTFRTNGELKAHVDHVHLKIPRPKRIRKPRKCDIPNLEY